MVYICTHVDFNEQPNRVDGYTILASNPLVRQYAAPVEMVAPNRITPMQWGYSEGFHIEHIYQHHMDEQWIGINHYRRYFGNVPMYRTILPCPRRYNMHRQFADAHNIEDLLQCETIINESYPEYKCEYDAIHLFTNNMFIMRQADFKAYHDFVFGVLDKFNEENDLHTDDDIYRFIERRYDKYNHKHGIKYHARLQGFLMERLGSIFFTSYFDIKSRKIHVVANRAPYGYTVCDREGK